jgi:hypothetical protein
MVMKWVRCCCSTEREKLEWKKRVGREKRRRSGMKISDFSS